MTTVGFWGLQFKYVGSMVECNRLNCRIHSSDTPTNHTQTWLMSLIELLVNARIQGFQV